MEPSNIKRGLCRYFVLLLTGLEKVAPLLRGREMDLPS